MARSCRADVSRLCPAGAGSWCGARSLAAAYVANASATAEDLLAVGVTLDEGTADLFYRERQAVARSAAAELLLWAEVCDLPPGPQRTVAVRLVPGWVGSAAQLLAAAGAVAEVAD